MDIESEQGMPVLSMAASCLSTLFLDNNCIHLAFRILKFANDNLNEYFITKRHDPL